MNAMIDAAHFVRSHRTEPSAPERIWGPLSGLTDAAAHAATGDGVVAITRGFDRNSRQRGKALRELLAEQDVATIEVTPAPGSERLLAGTDVSAVVNLVGAESWQPYRLAAKLRAPMLTPRLGDGEPADKVERDVIGMTRTDGTHDAALSHVSVRPEGTEESSLVITCADEPLSVPGGWATVTLHDQRLRITLAGPDFAEQTFAAQEIRIETFDGPYRLIRDELPIAAFEGALTIAAEPQGLTILSA
jgi:hypothetical protein